MEHTSAPWMLVAPIHVGGDIGTTPAHVRHEYRNEANEKCTKIIADIYNWDSGEGSANGRVLAAAPDLLDALLDLGIMRPVLDKELAHDFRVDESIIRAAREAVQRATA